MYGLISGHTVVALLVYSKETVIPNELNKLQQLLLLLQHRADTTFCPTCAKNENEESSIFASSFQFWVANFYRGCDRTIREGAGWKGNGSKHKE